MNLYPWDWPTWSQTLLIIGFVFAAGWAFLVLIERIDRWLDRRDFERAEPRCEAGPSLFDQDSQEA